MTSRDVRPVHVEFYRCGRPQPGAGWTRCKTPHLCQYHGCQVMQAEEMRERDHAGGGSVSTDIDQKRDGTLSASPLSDGPTDQPAEHIGAAT